VIINPGMGRASRWAMEARCAGQGWRRRLRWISRGNEDALPIGNPAHDRTRRAVP